MSFVFCHDHIFFTFDGKFYSPGKLTYERLSFYLNFTNELYVVGRSREVYSLDDGLFPSEGDGVKVIPVQNLASWRAVFYRKKVYAELVGLIKKVDAVIVRVPSEIGLMALEICKGMNKPVLVEVVASAYDCLNNRGDLPAKCYAPVLEWRMRRALKNATHVTYVTSNYLQTKYPSSGMTLAVSDVEIDAVVSHKRRNGTDVIRIGMIGNPDMKLKGASVAVNAIDILRGSGFNVELVVLGGSGERYKKENGPLPSWVSFCGVLSDKCEVMSWLDSLDIYIQPSLTEGLPRALIEGMSRGLPALGSRVGGIPELVRDDMLFKPGSSVELAKNISIILESEGKYNELSEYSLTVARRYLKYESNDARMDFYRQFVKSIPVPKLDALENTRQM